MGASFWLRRAESDTSVMIFLMIWIDDAITSSLVDRMG